MKGHFFILCCLFAISFGGECLTARCVSDGDCESDRATCCEGICVEPFPLGSACGQGICGSCQDFCVNGKCTEYDAGCSCKTDADCGSDPTRSFCLAGTCTLTYTLDAGEACQDSRQCYQEDDFILYCIGSTCQGNQTVDQSCKTSDGGSSCSPDLWCDENSAKCAQRLALGEICFWTRECVLGAVCAVNMTTFISECALPTPIGGNCTTSEECTSGACRLSTGKCVAAGSLPIGEVCDAGAACASGSCQFGAANYTQYCYEPNSTIPNGQWCYQYADNCIGICHCNSTNRCDPFDDITSMCISSKSLDDGSICQSSLQCKNECNQLSQTCYTMRSVNEGGECKIDEACSGTLRCILGICTLVNAGSRCTLDDDCAKNQECVCNGTSGTCQVTISSTIEYQFTQGTFETCLSSLEVYTRYAGYCTAGSDIFDAPLFCQKLLAQYTCCQGCILVNASNTYKNLSSIVPDFSGFDVSATVDCSTFTFSAAPAPCCGAANSTCALNKQVSSTKNCPGYVTSSSSTIGSSSQMPTTAGESDADAMRVCLLTIAAILALLA